MQRNYFALVGVPVGQNGNQRPRAEDDRDRYGEGDPRSLTGDDGRTGQGELFSRVGFIVDSMTASLERVVHPGRTDRRANPVPAM